MLFTKSGLIFISMSSFHYHVNWDTLYIYPVLHEYSKPFSCYGFKSSYIKYRVKILSIEWPKEYMSSTWWWDEVQGDSQKYLVLDDPYKIWSTGWSIQNIEYWIIHTKYGVQSDSCIIGSKGWSIQNREYRVIHTK